MKIKKITALFIVVFALFGKTFGQDRITFTWQADGEKVVKLEATEYKEFTVEWGDGTSIQTRMCEWPDFVAFLYHTYVEAGEYSVIITAASPDCKFLAFYCEGRDYSGINPPTNKQISRLVLTDCSELKHLICYNNLLTNLDLSGCPSLITLRCHDNLIEYLDLSMCSNITTLWCHNNRLQLDNLYELDLLLMGLDRILGTQNLLPQKAVIGEELFAQQSVLNGIFTKYTVSKISNPTIESDYTIVDGKLIFNSKGNYIVTMTNDAITPFVSVIVEINVGNVGISESSSFNIRIYPNPTNDYIYIESEDVPEIKLCSLDGKLLQNTHNKTINLSSYPTGIYLLSINGKTQKIIKH